jgi:hypothetical protein
MVTRVVGFLIHTHTESDVGSVARRADEDFSGASGEV